MFMGQGMGFISPLIMRLHPGLGGGGGVPEILPLQVVGSRGEINTLIGGATTSTNVKQNGRHRVYIGTQAVSELRLAYPGWYVDGATGELPAPDNYRVAASIQIGNVVKRVKFGGVNDGTVVAGETALISDALLPEEFGLEEFAPDTELWIKSEREVAVGGRFMYHVTPSYTYSTEGETYYVAATGAATQLDAVGPLASAGGWAIQAHVWLPLAVLGVPKAPMMAAAVLGDSQTNGDGAGTGDGLSVNGGGGIFRRGLADVNGRKVARMHLARSAEMAETLNGSKTHRMAMLQYVNHVLLNTGGNDYSNGRTVSQTIASVNSICSAIKTAYPDIWLEQYELIAKTNGDWTSVAGQTPRTGYEMGGFFRDAANNAFEALVGSTRDAFIRYAPGVYVDATQTDRFLANYTSDGTHCAAIGQAAQISANAEHLANLMVAHEGAHKDVFYSDGFDADGVLIDNVNWFGTTGTWATKIGGNVSLRDDNAGAFYTNPLPGTDQYAVVETVSSNWNGCSLIARFVDANNWVGVEQKTAEISLNQMLGGVLTEIGSFVNSPTTNAGDRIEIRVVGNAAAVYRNGLQIIDPTEIDETLVGLSCGFYTPAAVTTQVGTSFECGEYSGTEVVLPPPPPPWFSDSFNRANANLEASADWEHDGLIAGALSITSNQLRCNTNNATGSAYKCPDQGSLDHWVEYTVANTTANGGGFVCCRLADTNNFLGVRNNNSELQVYRRVAGSLTLLHSAPSFVAAGSVVRLEAEGDDYRVYVNGALVMEEPIGATLTSGRQGIVGRTLPTTPWIDNFVAGAILP